MRNRCRAAGLISDSGVVDEDINSPETVAHFVHEVAQRTLIAHVKRPEQEPTRPSPLDLMAPARNWFARKVPEGVRA
jgi:hypothetical protein